MLTKIKVLVCCMALEGCAKNSPAAGRLDGTAATSTPSGTPHRESGWLPACGEPASERELKSYWSVEVPGTYWLGMALDQGDWRPAHTLPMPHHHATRLELTNVAQFPELAQQRQGSLLRFSLALTKRESERVGERDAWRVTYWARIVAVCDP